MSTTEIAKLVIAVGILVTGQVLWKFGLNEIGTFSLSKDLTGSLIKVLGNGKILTGALLYTLSTAIYFDVLAKAAVVNCLPLHELELCCSPGSRVFPLERINYPAQSRQCVGDLGRDHAACKIIKMA